MILVFLIPTKEEDPLVFIHPSLSAVDPDSSKLPAIRHAMRQIHVSIVLCSSLCILIIRHIIYLESQIKIPRKGIIFLITSLLNNLC
jgi:hypothetical protein